MRTDNPYSSIQEKIITIEQLHKCIEQLREAADGLYKHKSEAKEVLEKAVALYRKEGPRNQSERD